MHDVKRVGFSVEQAVLDIGVKIVFAAVFGIDNREVSSEWTKRRGETIQSLLQKYQDLDFHADPVLEGYHILHDRSGVKRRKNIPANENLIRLLNKNGDMICINQAVDIYNIISMKSKLALGAHDLDRVDGDVTLRFTNGTERFVPIGQSEPVPVNAHEYCYCDASNEVLCRLEIRQVQKTKVDEDTRHIFYIVQGNDATDDALLVSTAQQIVDETTRYCGGEGRIIIPSVIP